MTSHAAVVARRPTRSCRSEFLPHSEKEIAEVDALFHQIELS
jgi:hypothetical protein